VFHWASKFVCLLRFDINPNITLEGAKEIILPSPKELFIVCLDILQTLCLAVLEGCHGELAPHLHTLVANIMPIAKLNHTSQGKKVGMNILNIFVLYLLYLCLCLGPFVSKPSVGQIIVSRFI